MFENYSVKEKISYMSFSNWPKNGENSKRPPFKLQHKRTLQKSNSLFIYTPCPESSDPT